MVRLLSTTETETPAADVLTNAWGEHHILCQTYGSDATLQVKTPDGTWNNASYNGSEIVLTAAGEIAEVRMIPEYEYRISTPSAGSEVFIAPYTTKHNPNP